MRDDSNFLPHQDRPVGEMGMMRGAMSGSMGGALPHPRAGGGMMDAGLVKGPEGAAKPPGRLPQKRSDGFTAGSYEEDDRMPATGGMGLMNAKKGPSMVPQGARPTTGA